MLFGELSSAMRTRIMPGQAPNTSKVPWPGTRSSPSCTNTCHILTGLSKFSSGGQYDSLQMVCSHPGFCGDCGVSLQTDIGR